MLFPHLVEDLKYEKVREITDEQDENVFIANETNKVLGPPSVVNTALSLAFSGRYGDVTGFSVYSRSQFFGGSIY